MVKRQLTVLRFFTHDFASIRFVAALLLLAVFYLFISTALINVQLINSIFQNPLILTDKLRIAIAIIFHGLSSEPFGNLSLNIMISLLFAANILFVIKKLGFVSKQKNLHLTFGAGFISLASSGCAACGFSILSLAGLGGAVSILPFQGLELTIFGAALLFLTGIYNLNSLYKECEITR